MSMQTPEEAKRTRVVYDEQVQPLLSRVYDICEANGIGFMAYVASSMEEMPDGNPLIAVHRFLTRSESCTCPHIDLMGAVEQKDIDAVQMLLGIMLLGEMRVSKEHPGATSEAEANKLIARLMGEKK